MNKNSTDYSSITVVGLDLAKHVFQVHAIDAEGHVICAKAIRRKDLLGPGLKVRRFSKAAT